MCCDDPVEIPPYAAAMRARYATAREAGSPEFSPEFPFGASILSLLRFAGTEEVVAVLESQQSAPRPLGWAAIDWPVAVSRLVSSHPLLPGFVHVQLDSSDGEPGVTRSAAPVVLPDGETLITVVIGSTRDRTSSVRCGGQVVEVPPCSGAFLPVLVHAAERDLEVEIDGEVLVIPDVVRCCAAAELTLRTAACSRWRVEDDSGGGWYPASALQKRDFHNRPFFHAHETTVLVPAAPLTVAVTRGLEFAESTVQVVPAAGEAITVELEPARIVNPAASGWYGGDLHVHLNYGGETCDPADAARMQRGERLHVLNLVAANMATSLVFEEAMLDAAAGTDLPWSDSETIARIGVEYRNDLFGHFHAFDPQRPPQRYQSGHPLSENPDDWPPNAAACEELRELGSLIGYTHPVFLPFAADGAPDRMLSPDGVRLPDARELIADAALGLVDAVDLVSNADHWATVDLYYHLLNCGLRLAATAGTDSMLSRTWCGHFSNPPGWGRVYAQVEGALTAASWKEAVRRCATIATNGPWIRLEVNGHGPGALLDVEPGAALSVFASAEGHGSEVLELVTSDGVVRRAGRGEEELLTAEVELATSSPTWIAARVSGPANPQVLDSEPFGHTTPVFVSVQGAGVLRSRDARWCLDYLDGLERLVASAGKFSSPAQLEDFVEVVARARSIYEEVYSTAVLAGT